MAKTYIPSTVRALAAYKAAKKRLAAKLKKVKQEWWEHEGKRLCYAYNNAYRRAIRVRVKVTKKGCKWKISGRNKLVRAKSSGLNRGVVLMLSWLLLLGAMGEAKASSHIGVNAAFLPHPFGRW